MWRKVILFVSAICLLPSIAFAEVPPAISYQGILKDTTGAPVEDDVYAIKFAIYGDSTAGSPLWETAGYVPLQTSDGLFMHVLGSTNAIPDSIAQFDQLWVGLKVNLEPEMTPRTRLISVPFALKAGYADSSKYSQFSSSADTTKFSFNADSLGGLGRPDFIEENEPNTIDSTMIKNGSISALDIGFSGFHQVKQAYANNTFYQNATVSWQDINALNLELDVEGDSALTYVSLSIQRVPLPRPTVEIRIVVDDIEITSGEYSLHYDSGNPYVVSSVNLNRIVALSAGHHIIKGQFRRYDGTYFQTLSGKDRILIAIFLR
jgi:hypothetical protein